ncbi:dipeptide ABC superfamily ATP binding cassette transporter, ABC protein [Centipeda periodontii DSM 2778]|uniref:Dipeptide ABC superfamily ATP binding cassette transporter, ABC protein n=1 Tax=Centipeda periodontii DSM 2778 TaxID=888060 RepID=F5RL55_9FIRM|nr:ATP-binding cassette domain-containing protein [Centipeda periodontii]EGK60641.1 dipeptide ABC superfamily ATP binding cassette transporter, ABC protein [Centipeda periodontii DSM 2778]
MLDAKDLSYRYGEDSPVLWNVSLRVADGERLALLGPSGRGKSTLALLLAGYLPLQQGTITLDGASLPKGGYNPVQLIYQHPEKAMDPRWKVGATLREAWDVPQELLTAIGAEPDWLSRWPHELSGGQLQRLSILRALSPKTRVLIADEITASLDPITQAQIWSVILREIEKNRTMLIAITHNEALAQRICTRMVHIEELQG